MSCPGCGFFLEGRFPLEEQDDDWYAHRRRAGKAHPNRASWYYTDNDEDGDCSLNIFVGKDPAVAEALAAELRFCGMADVEVEEGCGGTTSSVRAAA
jgi:hypothetical protein